MSVILGDFLFKANVFMHRPPQVSCCPGLPQTNHAAEDNLELILLLLDPMYLDYRLVPPSP